MAAQVNGLLHRGADVGVDPLGQIHHAVGGALGVDPAVQLVHIAAALEPEMLEQLIFRRLADDGHVEFAGGLDHIVGQVLLVHRDADAVGGGGDLPGGIDDAAVVLAVLMGGEHKQAVAEVVHGFFVHSTRLLFRFHS